MPWPRYVSHLLIHIDLWSLRCWSAQFYRSLRFWQLRLVRPRPWVLVNRCFQSAFERNFRVRFPSFRLFVLPGPWWQRFIFWWLKKIRSLSWTKLRRLWSIEIISRAVIVMTGPWRCNLYQIVTCELFLFLPLVSRWLRIFVSQVVTHSDWWTISTPEQVLLGQHMPKWPISLPTGKRWRFRKVYCLLEARLNFVSVIW